MIKTPLKWRGIFIMSSFYSRVATYQTCILTAASCEEV